jgi:predicted transposase YbfD/YdcC
LELLELHGAFVTIDAMGCQRAIAAKIIERKRPSRNWDFQRLDVQCTLPA